MIWFHGPIEEYQVRDCTTGEDWPFRDFDEAESYLEKRRIDYPTNAIILIAVIDGGN